MIVFDPCGKGCGCTEGALARNKYGTIVDAKLDVVSLLLLITTLDAKV